LQLSNRESVGEGLVLRGVRDERDVERFIAFNRDINGETEAEFCTRLLRNHPRTQREEFLLVEDENTGQVVSTTCLIPWECRYDGISLRVAMLEMVATHPQYRRQGLVRAQIARFHRTVVAQGYDLSIIQGIPYYYRQYGYAYALAHSGADTLPVWHIPGPETAPSSPYILREATTVDAPTLARLYEQGMAEVEIYVQRDEAFWTYLLEAVRLPVQILEDRRTGQAGGYMALRTVKSGRGTSVVESAILGMDAAGAAMRALQARGGEEIRLGWPESGPLVQLGRSLGGRPAPSYQWLWRVTDVARLLERIAPALDGRLATAGHASLTIELVINLYREAFLLQIQAGRVAGVKSLGFVDASLGADGGDLCVPPEAFARLVLGYRTLDELLDAWPDIVVKAEKRALVDILFPKLSSCILMPY
jgi:predicted N-acetyltransferase YhbS